MSETLSLKQSKNMPPSPEKRQQQKHATIRVAAVAGLAAASSDNDQHA